MKHDWYNDCRLVFGDFRDTLAAADGQADLVACSPPYCDARTYGADVSWGDEDYAALGDAVFSALKPGGHALINVDAPVREWRKGFGTERGFHAWRLMFDWAERVGFRVPDRLTFDRLGTPGAYTGRFRNDWEPLLWFQKPGAPGHFSKEALADFAGGQKKSGPASNRRPDGSLYKRARSGWACENGATHRGTAWRYGPVGKGHSGAPDIEAENHPARWPYRLAEDIVRCFCPPGGLTVDPFVGAGTTAAAALENDRRFLGGDLFHKPETGESWVSVTARVLHARSQKVS